MMGMLLAFAPFIAFALVSWLLGSVPGLICGALIAGLFLLRDALARGRTVKVLEIGTVLLFAGLAVYVGLGGPQLGIFGIRFFVDAGLLLIVLVSIAIRLPFTLQYAREQTPEALWERPEFVRANYIITGVWALAFAIMVAADFVLFFLSDVPSYIGIIATVVAIIGAVRFTVLYPQRLRARLAS
jgi:hypothetical protein